MRAYIRWTWLILICCLGNEVSGQSAILHGQVREKDSREGIEGMELILDPVGLTAETDAKGNYTFSGLERRRYKVILLCDEGKKSIAYAEIKGDSVRVDFEADPNSVKLKAVVIQEDRGAFGMSRLRSVEGAAIYASKKNDVILIDSLAANLATNNSRQIYAKVAGLNIWESDGAGLQLGIGGRGLSPNRTSNFNVRQNGYDISADALGYPESYYTPPVEALKRIEVVRGAASLQYGTQFGGLLNFVFKEGPEDKAIEVVSRNTAGSFGFFNTFTSVGGTKGRLNYYAYYQYKRGNGWRPNSGFNVHNTYGNLNFKVSTRLTLGMDYTFMQYEAQQAGGLTDALFDQNPRQSIRDRNWFKVNWNLMALTADYVIGPNTDLNIRNFGLLAQRNALGFLGLISRTDPLEERDLIKGDFRNFGNETRLIHRYNFNKLPAAFLTGVRYYNGYATGIQGLASAGDDADFELLNPNNPENSDYQFPSRNVSVFAENVFNLSEKISITPGARFEFIRTESDGYYVERVTDLAGNVLFEEKIEDGKFRQRSFILGGIGGSYKPSEQVEIYANFSQNYRAINFNDLRIVNPNFRVDENLQDERGFNADLGVRGKIGKIFSYDVSLFHLFYRDRIGLVLKTDTTLFNVYRYRTNVADSRTWGLESFAELDIFKLFAGEDAKTGISLFTNFAVLDARYFNSSEPAIEGKQVELAPPASLRYGLSLGRSGFRASIQQSFTARHFTDATNAEFTPTAVNGAIPAYTILDLALSWEHKFLKVDAGINNLSNQRYFTRRASGYPGPGIIPADGRSWYLGLQVKL